MPGLLSKIRHRTSSNTSNAQETRTTTTVTSIMSAPSAVSSFLAAMKTRRSVYALTNKSTISDERLQELVQEALLHVPSGFNVQSARVVILLGDNHRKLWQIGAKHMKKVIPADNWPFFENKIKGLENAHGSVLFFEDQEALTALGNAHQSVKSEIPQFSENSAGMHHFAVWTMLSLEGLGANLQHYNMLPPFSKEVAETWNIPESWKLGAQLVFGTPSAPAGERQYSPVEPRLKVFA